MSKQTFWNGFNDFLKHIKTQGMWYIGLPMVFFVSFLLVIIPYFLTGRRAADDLVAMVSLAPNLVALGIILAMSFFAKDYMGTGFVRNIPDTPLSHSSIWCFIEVYFIALLVAAVIVNLDWKVLAALGVPFMGCAWAISQVCYKETAPPPAPVTTSTVTITETTNGQPVTDITPNI